LLGDRSDARAASLRSIWLVFRRHLAALRARPETLEIMAWETVERNELTAALAAVRETRSLAVMKAPVGRFAVPAGFGVVAFDALFGAATNYLLIRARGIRAFQGFDPGKPGGRERMFKTIE
jgi:hypothetical protein